MVELFSGRKVANETITLGIHRSKHMIHARDSQRRHQLLLMGVAFYSINPTSSLLFGRPSKIKFGNDHWSVTRRGRPYSCQTLFQTPKDVSSTYNPSGQEVDGSGDETITDDEYAKLIQENVELQEKVGLLEEEVKHLRSEASHRKIILESFEGENRIEYARQEPWLQGINSSPSSQWCDELEDEACPIEPMLSFGEALRDRALWLVGLLMVQSFSGIILAHNEALLTKHPVSTFHLGDYALSHNGCVLVIYYLTMLVGAGGNAGNQASVRVIRGLALGTLNEKTQAQFLTRELKMAGALSAILSFAGFLRTLVFRTPIPEIIAVTSSLAMIVLCSVCLGAVLPIGLKRIGVDPAHSSTSIQVLMDILGVVLAVLVSSFLLDSSFGKFLLTRLIGAQGP